MDHMADTLPTQTQDMVAVAVALARPDQRVFIQNTITAAVHKAKGNDDGSTMSGWSFAKARKKGARFMPSTMISQRCMPTERAIAEAVGIEGGAELSCDEFGEN